MLKGIISVLQLPFIHHDQIDYDSLAKLIEEAIDANVNGFLVPAGDDQERGGNPKGGSLLRACVF